MTKAAVHEIGQHPVRVPIRLEVLAHAPNLVASPGKR
jgi:hypothetical protein